MKRFYSVFAVCLGLFTPHVMAVDLDELTLTDAFFGAAGTVGLVILGLLGVTLMLVGFGFVWGIITGMEYQNGFRFFKSRDSGTRTWGRGK